MKKTFNWLVAMFAIVAVCTACSKGDDGPNNPADAIIGKWECVHSEGWYKVDGVIDDEWSEPNTGWGWVFNKGGKGYNFEIGYDDYEMNWSINQNKLSIIYTEDDIEEVYTIASISKNEMVLIVSYVMEGGSIVSTDVASPTTRLKNPDIVEHFEKLTFVKKN